MDWLDRNPDIISWASEELVIPYISPVDNRQHRYFPDFLVKMKTREGKTKTVLIEVKPKYSVLRLTSSLSVADNTELLVRSQLSKETPPAPNRQRDAAAEGRERNRSLLTDY